MKNGLVSIICEFLYESDRMVISGLGLFYAHDKSASIDHIQGVIYPPSKVIEFRADPTIFDEKLPHYIAEQQKISLEEAKQMIQLFVLETTDSLNKREIVMLDELGRLYMDYENNIRFLPNNFNFNTDSFGLPVIQAFPVLRNKENMEPKPSQANFEKKPAKKKAKNGMLKSMGLSSSMALALGLIVLASGLFFMNKNEAISFHEKLAHPVSQKEIRVNTKPVLEKEDDLGLVEEEVDVLTITPKKRTKDEDGSYETAINTEGSTLAPDERTCIIIIGQFSKRQGVRLRVEELFELGFDAYQDKNPKNGLTRVGVQFAYEERNELLKNLKFLRKKFDKHAWVLRE